jgi:hypothetical protein
VVVGVHKDRHHFPWRKVQSFLASAEEFDLRWELRVGRLGETVEFWVARGFLPDAVAALAKKLAHSRNEAGIEHLDDQDQIEVFRRAKLPALACKPLVAGRSTD